MLRCEGKKGREDEGGAWEMERAGVVQICHVPVSAIHACIFFRYFEYSTVPVCHDQTRPYAGMCG